MNFPHNINFMLTDFSPFLNIDISLEALIFEDFISLNNYLLKNPFIIKLK